VFQCFWHIFHLSANSHKQKNRSFKRLFVCGANRVRTGDLLTASQTYKLKNAYFVGIFGQEEECVTGVFQKTGWFIHEAVWKNVVGVSVRFHAGCLGDSSEKFESWTETFVRLVR